jgi:uncharacterized membrane protein
MRYLLPSLAAALAVAACQPQAPDGATAPPPADAPGGMTTPGPSHEASTLDLSQPLLARGNEPFWAVRIDGTRLTLQRPGEADKLFEAPGAVVTPGQARWEARGADGQLLTVSLYASRCSDGMSDFAYPLVAEVKLLDRTYSGCAAKVSELPRGA